VVPAGRVLADQRPVDADVPQAVPEAADALAYDGEVGDLLWNPKAGDGHVLVAEVPCGGEFKGRSVDCGCGGWGVVPCPSTTVVCECGEDGSWRDHHYEILARAAR
jgi:hypothetical protein